ncbi:MAG: HEPN domain-containing protein [Acaryochloridaceae cyanobacterium RL_2_7]|nr:HEPN domain-containing protein [Acaryochloridaceae cyanobacterium RL_2_7]
MNDRDQAKVLLQAASRDLRALEGMGDPSMFADEIFGFHVQQAAEKGLKAWIALQGEGYPFTHDLNMLLRLLENMGCPVEPFWALSEYTVFAVQLRYAAFLGADERIDRSAAIAQAKALYTTVGTVLKQTQ